ncbi:hypothetical protein QQ045_026263 [Rhodiola kirilowii]
MAFHLQATITCLCLSLISIHAALPSEQYWNSMLPATPMPRAITLALRPGQGAKHVMVGNDCYGNCNYNDNKHVVAEPKEALKIAGNDGYGNSNYQNNEQPVKALKLAGNDGYGNSGYSSINGRHAATDPLTGMKIVAVNPPTALFFLEKDLYPGKEMSLEINRRENSASAAFIPLRVSNSIPFSSDKLSTIFDKFSVKPESKEAELMKRTLNMCSLPAGKGEKKQCVTSLESMVDFTIASLGKNIQAISTEAEKDTKLQKFKIINGIKKLANDEAVVCHKETYPYAVFLCHDLKATRSYLVPLIGADGTKAKATAVCHIDTSGWNPEHLALRVLNVKAGTVPVCHFLPEYDVVWTKK